MIILSRFVQVAPTLPLGELEAVLQAEKIDYWLLKGCKSYSLHKISRWKGICERLALTHEVYEVLSESETLEDLVSEKVVKQVNSPFWVNFKCLEKPCRLEADETVKEVADRIWLSMKEIGKEPSVKPGSKEQIYVLETREKIYLARNLCKVDKKQFEQRAPPKRPAFMPVSMDPRIARAMVNLSRVRRGKKLLDPCCGTGGILLEAASIGCKVYGVDIDAKMVEATKKNLAHYGFYGSVKQGDCRNLSKVFHGRRNVFDAIVCDFPYGRATKKVPSDFYGECLEQMVKLLKPGCFMVISMDSELKAPEGTFLVELHKQRVHKSLTRYIHVFKKIEK